MRVMRIAVVLAVAAQPLAAQAAVQAQTSRAGALTAEIHYTTAGDAWFETSRPAYVALFDVSRGGVAQLYPTFTQQATELSGTSVRVDLRSRFAGPGLVSLSTPSPALDAQGWPHTLLLVASTMPLRVGNSWTTNIALNNDLVRDHQWNTLSTDEGVAAVIRLVRPLDWGAEVVTDQVQTATPVMYASSLTHDPTTVGIAYSCNDAMHTFVSLTPMLGASCVAIRGMPATGLAAMASASAKPGGVGAPDTAHVVATSVRPAGTTRISDQKHADVQSISDPAAIRQFMERLKTGRGTDGSATTGSQGGQMRDQPRPQQHDPAHDAAPAARRDAERSSSAPSDAGVRPRRDAQPPRSVDVKPPTPPTAPPGTGKPPSAQE